MEDDLANCIILRLQSTGTSTDELESLLTTYWKRYGTTTIRLPDPWLGHGTTLLHEVLKKRPSERLLTLLSLVLDPQAFTTGDNMGRMPLHQSILFRNSFPVIHALAVSNPVVIGHMDRVGETPIDLLLRDLQRMDPPVTSNFVNVLLDIYPQAIDCTNREGENLLHRALRSRALSLPSLASLITRKPSLVLGHDASGRTPIHIACWADFGRAPELIATILNSCQAPVEEILSLRDALGSTPLHWAANMSDSERLIGTLVRAYPEALQMTNGDGDTPLQSFYKANRRFFEKGSVPVVRRMLLRTVSALLTVKSQPILHVALSEPKCPMEIIRFLAHQPCFRDQIYLADKNGNLPLHLACQRCPKEVRSSRMARSPLRPEMFHYRLFISELLAAYPDSALRRNHQHELPLTVMHRAGHKWNEMLLVLSHFPSAVLDLGLNESAFSNHVCRLSQCDTNALFQLTQESPFLFLR